MKSLKQWMRCYLHFASLIQEYQDLLESITVKVKLKNIYDSYELYMFLKN